MRRGDACSTLFQVGTPVLLIGLLVAGASFAPKTQSREKSYTPHGVDELLFSMNPMHYFSSFSSFSPNASSKGGAVLPLEMQLLYNSLLCDGLSGIDVPVCSKNVLAIVPANSTRAKEVVKEVLRPFRGASSLFSEGVEVLRTSLSGATRFTEAAARFETAAAALQAMLRWRRGNAQSTLNFLLEEKRQARVRACVLQCFAIPVARLCVCVCVVLVALRKRRC